MIKLIIPKTLCYLGFAALFSGHASAEISEEEFFTKREALIIKHAHNDATFAALRAQVDEREQHSAEHWRWRVDQYLYGQYPEYQPLYDTFTEGKAFNEIYALPPEDLGPPTPEPTKLPALPEGYFTGNLLGNPHTGWHDKANNKVYVVYQGHLSDPYIASFDLKTQAWDGPYKAGDSTLSKGNRKFDSHGRPVIERDSKGHFHIIFGGHGGEREDGLNPMSIDTPHAGGRMLHVMSEKPNDISKFVAVDDITPFASYTASHRMENGDIYFFTRAGTHKSPWLMYKMENGKQRFNEPVVLTWPTPQKEDPIYVDTMYINPKKVSDTEIVISYLWHNCNFHEVHDKTNYGRHNAYYVKLDTSDDTFYNVKGEKLTLPITMALSHEKTLAYDSVAAKETSFGTRPLVLADGTPALAYEARNPGYREWRMAAYKNGKWEHSLPLPGQAGRTITDVSGQPAAKVLSFEILSSAKKENQAAAVFRDNKGKSVFALVSRKNNGSNNWVVEEEYFRLAKARVMMNLVKDDKGEAVAALLGVRKGSAQRLYLWHKGEFKGNPAIDL